MNLAAAVGVDDDRAVTPGDVFVAEDHPVVRQPADAVHAEGTRAICAASRAKWAAKWAPKPAKT